MPSQNQGATRQRYTVIPRTLIFLTRGQEILLLKGAPHKRLWAGLYNGLGGHIERGEDPLTAARRELTEESGLHADLWLAATVTIDTGSDSLGILLFVFRGEVTGGRLRPSEEGEAHWLPLADLDPLPLVEDLRTLLPDILRQPAGAPPLHYLYTYDDAGRLHIASAN
ncbi:MAG: 8-oxo-dGTP diphosphatase [Anaerolineales bacterium]